MPQMHQQDVDQLRIALATTDLPKSVTDTYALYQRVWSRLSSGAMPLEMIAQIAVQSGQVKPPEVVKSVFGDVKEGQAIFWQPSPYDEEQVTFLRMLEPWDAGEAEVLTVGGPRRVPVSRLSLKSRTETQVAPEPATEKPAAVEEAPKAEEDSTSASIIERLKEEFPTDTDVEVAVPGETPFSAVTKGVGSGKFAGRIKVEDKATSKQRWVAVEDVLKAVSA